MKVSLFASLLLFCSSLSITGQKLHFQTYYHKMMPEDIVRRMDKMLDLTDS